MDQRGAPEFILEAFADPNSVRDIVRGECNPTNQPPGSGVMVIPCPSSLSRALSPRRTCSGDIRRSDGPHVQNTALPAHLTANITTNIERAC